MVAILIIAVQCSSQKFPKPPHPVKTWKVAYFYQIMWWNCVFEILLEKCMTQEENFPMGLSHISSFYYGHVDDRVSFVYEFCHIWLPFRCSQLPTRCNHFHRPLCNEHLHSQCYSGKFETYYQLHGMYIEILNAINFKYINYI